MSTIVFDPLYVKTIEKEIGRKLDEMETEAIRYGEPIFIQSKKGRWASYQVPYYNYPHDLMIRDADLALQFEDKKHVYKSVYGSKYE